MSKRLTRIEKKANRDATICEMFDQRYTHAVIAKTVRVHTNTVRNVLLADGRIQVGKRRKRYITAAREARITKVVEAITAGESISSIAKRMGVTRMQIYHDRNHAQKTGEYDPEGTFKQPEEEDHGSEEDEYDDEYGSEE